MLNAKRTPVRAESTLTMQQAVERAYVHKPSVQAYQHAITAAQRQQKGKLAPFIPNISLSETIHDNNSNTKAENALGISANQTILDLSTRDAYRIAGKTVEKTELLKETHKHDIRKQVELAFLNAWLQQQRVRLIAAQFRSAHETFKQDKHKKSLDLYGENDWLKTTVNYSSNLTTVRTYTDDVAIAQHTLSYFTGMPLVLLPTAALHPEYKGTKLQWTPQKKFALASRETYYTQARNNRPEIKQLEKDIETESLYSDFYTKKYVPSVNIYASGSKYIKHKTKSQWTHDAGIKVSWNIFDGAANYFEKSAADARKLKAILNRNDLIEKIRLDVQTAYSNVKKAIKTFDTTTITLNQERNEYALKKQEYQLGTISPVDFDQARFKWEQAKFAWATQAVTAAQKERELDYACGYTQVT